MLKRYQKFLEIIDEKLDNMFKKQAPFIKCKAGCSLCCEEGEYPISELEYLYLMKYSASLGESAKSAIKENIINLINNKKKIHRCPFLINGICSVYPARPIICRTFGLIAYTKKGRKKIPFCVNKGLNYSEVYDKESSTITKCAQDGTEPCAFNIDRIFLRSKEMEAAFNIYFGEDRAMRDWLIEVNP